MQASKILKSKIFKRCAVVFGLATVSTGAVAVFLSPTPAFANDGLHAPKYDWYHKKLFSSYDHKALRRGYQVYRQVCSACHSLDQIYYRYFVNEFLTEAEAKAIAAESTIIDGPDDEGKMFERPRVINDKLPSPYANKNEAKAANNGALPPDMSLLVLAREQTENYVFQLLTSYCDAPAGVELDEGQHYNPYMTDGKIGMARPLYDDMLEYEDGTPATTSQMAKDVTVFLSWLADPHVERRKVILLQMSLGTAIFTAVMYYLKRYTWSYVNMSKVYKRRVK